METVYIQPPPAYRQTPVLHLSRLGEKYGCAGLLFAKLESLNPSGSVKDRSVYFMIKRAMENGLLSPGGTVVAPTAGNSAVSCAMVCASLGLEAVFVVPGDLPESKKKHLELYGARLRLVPAASGMDGAMEEARRLTAKSPGSFLLSQFDNPDGCMSGRAMAEEVFSSFENIDYFVAGVGTGATITGMGEEIKKRCPDCRIIAVEPTSSPVLSGGYPGAHPLAGIGPGFIPEILNTYILDEVISVKTPDALELCRALARLHGLLCGPSSGAALAAAISVACRPESAGKTVLTVLPDLGERYLDLL